MRPERAGILEDCLLLSGASSLVLEVAWSRALSLSLGNSHQAVATVVASMMAGLCLGSLLAARLLPRLRRLPRAYGLVEIGIGLYAALTPLVFSALPAILAPLYALPQPAFAAARFLLVFLLLLPAAGGMGATLPIVTAALTSRETSPDEAAIGGRLYGLNTLGAFVGTLLGGFALLPHLGLLKSTLLAAATSAGIGALVVSILGGVVRILPEGTAAGDAAPQPLAEGGIGRPAAGARGAAWVLPLYAISGGLAMVYEVTWTRVLAPLVGTSVYSFALILAAILAGIGLGSLLLSARRTRSIDPAKGFVLGQIALSVTAFASVWALKYFPVLVVLLAARASSSTWALFLGEFALLAGIVFLPGMVLGALFPFAARLLERSGAEAGAAVGRVYAWNTAGSILGALAAGFVLVETLGSERTLVLASTASACVALLGLVLAPGRRFRLGAGAAATAAAFAFPFCSARWDPGMMAGGISHVLRELAKVPAGTPPSRIPAMLLPLWDHVIFHQEGKTSTITVAREGSDTTLLVDGKADASTNQEDMLTQVLLGQLPFLFARQARDVCVVGYGSGVTCHAVLTHPVRRLDTLEIERQVIEASRYFAGVNRDPLADPRNHLIVEDARTALLYRPQTYDVIINEPSNPWIAGVNNLFTLEFYRLVRKRLNPGGIFCQWVQTYEMSQESFRTILDTLGRVFPHALVFVPILGDVILLVSDEPLALLPGAGALFPERAQVAPDLARVGVKNLAEIAALYQGTFRPPSPEGLLNTDDNSIIQYRLALELLRGEEVPIDLPLVYSPETVLQTFFPGREESEALLDLARGLGRHEAVDGLARLREWLGRAGDKAAVREVVQLETALRDRLLARSRVDALLDQAEKESQARDQAAALASVEKALGAGLARPEDLSRAGYVLLNFSQYARAEPLFDRALAAATAEPPYLPLVGRGASRVALGRREAGLADIASAKAILPGHPFAYFCLGRALADAGDRAAAIHELRAGILAAPRDSTLRAALRALESSGGPPPAAAPPPVPKGAGPRR